MIFFRNHLPILNPDTCEKICSNAALLLLLAYCCCCYLSAAVPTVYTVCSTVCKLLAECSIKNTNCMSYIFKAILFCFMKHFVKFLLMWMCPSKSSVLSRWASRFFLAEKGEKEQCKRPTIGRPGRLFEIQRNKWIEIWFMDADLRARTPGLFWCFTVKVGINPLLHFVKFTWIKFLF